MVLRYIESLKFQIQDVVNMFDPVYVSAAHQRALMVEKQTKRNSNTAIFSASAGSGSGVNKAVGSSSGGQFNRTGGLKCFGCGEVGHRKSECKKTAGKSALFMDTDDYAEDELQFEGEPMHDREEATEEMHLEGDVGTALVVRRSYFTPKASSEEPWLRSNIFQSTCTIKDKVCRFVIDGGSCENIVSIEAVQKLNIQTEKSSKTL